MGILGMTQNCILWGFSSEDLGIVEYSLTAVISRSSVA